MFSSKDKELKLEDEHILAKFVFRGSELKADGKITPSVLKPKAGNMLSLTEVSDLEHSEICIHGRRHVDNPAAKRIHIGYGKFKCQALRELDLITVYDNDPVRHVSVGFPDEPEKRREVSKALSNEALVVSPASIKKYFSQCE